MNPLAKALIGALVRAVMMMAGAYGVELGTHEDAEKFTDAALIVGAMAWSAWQKYKAHERITTAEMPLMRGR